MIHKAFYSIKMVMILNESRILKDSQKTMKNKGSSKKRTSAKNVKAMEPPSCLRINKWVCRPQVMKKEKGKKFSLREHVNRIPLTMDNLVGSSSTAKSISKA